MTTTTLHLEVEVADGYVLSLLTQLATDPRIESLEMRSA